jgi:hypothetical protein
MRASSLAIGLVLALAVVPAQAQTQAPKAAPIFVRGTVEKLAGTALTLKSRDGSDVTINLAPDFKVSGLEKQRLSDIHQGDYVASTGHRGSDGKLHAIEVRILPEALRGVGEGQFPWDLMPGSTMTNATVTGISGAPQGATLTVSYKGKQSTFIVDPDTVILAYTKGDAGQLKPGAVFVTAMKAPDGKLVAKNVTAETNGIKPPM